ncbi:MAG: VWA domain-containing protein [bacterium]|nr:VWA domain-containing protein [bacterium]
MRQPTNTAVVDRSRAVRWSTLLLCLLALGALGQGQRSVGSQDTEEETGAPLPSRYQRWLEDVEALMSEAEREVFLTLSENYQRDHFIRRFWKVRDPFSQTARNELQELWEQRATAVREQFSDLSSNRARMTLYFGQPSRSARYTCDALTRPLEVWEYDQGSDRIRGYFTIVFVGLVKGERSAAGLWEPSQGLSKLMMTSRGFGADDRQLAQLVGRECSRGDELISALAQALEISRLLDDGPLFPKPNDEWVRSFQARSTDVAEGAEPLAAEMLISFPGRHQSRTVVQGLVAVPAGEAEAGQLGDYRSYNLLVDGEVLRKGELFDTFRYRFDFPAASVTEQIPLVVQRYLRPGSYELIVKVEDLNSKRAFRDQRELEVPRVERRQPARTTDGTTVEAADAAASSASATGDPAPGSGKGTVSSFGVLLNEANASISTGDHTVKILPLPEKLTVGQLRVEAQARGEDIARVGFLLNGQPVMRKSRPPYSVEINLGDTPRIHTLRAVALDSDGKTLATDEVLINAGPHRFAVRLIEPQPGKRYTTSVRAHAEVEVPEGERLDKVEFYFNEVLLATLYQPPFEQPILLRGDEELSYVRVAAYLRGGNSAEDVRIINAPDYIDALDVQFVELYTTVLDRAGNFVEDLQQADFTVLEDGAPQQVRRFESMSDLPIRAGLVIDTSLSMLTSLSDVKKAAHRFFETVLTERDRAALITFADEPQLAVRFTNNQEVLAGGLAALNADGETALFDSVIFSLHYFSGLSGKRAVVILTDGEDSVSTYTYQDAIDFARHTGVAIYIVGLRLQSSSHDVRMKMQRLAHETGGEVFFIERASQLEKVYDSIQEELRSQYLIAYQSSVEGAEFRRVEIEMHRKGLEAKTIRGYYP